MTIVIIPIPDVEANIPAVIMTASIKFFREMTLFSDVNTYSATDARTGVYREILNEEIFDLVLGNGYGNVESNFYYPSWAFNLWCLGLIGTTIILCIYIKYFISCTRIDTKIILFVNAFLCMGTTWF